MSKANKTPIIPLSMNETILLYRICKALDYDTESIPSFGKPTYVGIRIKGKGNPKNDFATINKMFAKHSGGKKLTMDNPKHICGVYSCTISKVS